VMSAHSTTTTGQVIEVNDETHFAELISSAGTKLIVIDVYAHWCGPCKNIAPFVEQLAQQYKDTALFLKVDADNLAKQLFPNETVSALPTFQLRRASTVLEQFSGADKAKLERLVKKHASVGSDLISKLGLSQQFHVIDQFIDIKGLNCLNENDEDGHVISNALKEGNAYLESDVDEQLLINIPFQSEVKIHSIKFSAEKISHAPKVVKIFVNYPNLDFGEAEDTKPLATLNLCPKDFEQSSYTPLEYVNFQRVNVLTLFVEENQNDEETTRIDRIQLIGVGPENIDMNAYKRVSGKKGEAHI